MTRRPHYPLARHLVQFANMLHVDLDRILRRAGLPRDFIDNEGKGATPEQIIATWRALEAEVTRPDLARFMATAFAHGPFVPAMFAFSCSPDVETGLRRLAVFKPLIGPVRLNLSNEPDGLMIEITHEVTELPVPALMAVFETLFILESARTYTAHHIVPMEIGLPEPTAMRDDDRAYAGATPVRNRNSYLKLTLEDAARPLVTENSEAWPDFERRMRAKLAERDASTPMIHRARATLIDMLPSGDASIEALSARLAVSKRSLQRHLKEEGESFKSVLSATRSELALNYLEQNDLSIEEISYLLAYREPNSFYRAFQGWTGMTPSQARDMRAI